jgi:hypothetical protein
MLISSNITRLLPACTTVYSQSISSEARVEEAESKTFIVLTYAGTNRVKATQIATP